MNDDDWPALALASRVAADLIRMLEHSKLTPQQQRRAVHLLVDWLNLSCEEKENADQASNSKIYQ